MMWFHQALPCLFLLFCLNDLTTAKLKQKMKQTTLSDDHPRFFIYDWPAELINCWPITYSHHRLAIEKKFRENYGIGPSMQAGIGMYHTHQYSLFETFYHRLLESKYRTQDPEKANYFFIPYDIGMDASTRQSDGALFQTNCPKIPTIIELLSKSPYFNKNLGSNHFMLHSINQPMNYYLNIKCMEFYKYCFNCTKLSIDTYSPELYRVLKDNPCMTNKWISIPFPSNFHLSRNVTSPLWKRTHLSRSYAIAYMGGLGVTSKLSKDLRIVLQNECSRHKDCLFVNLNSHTSQANIFNHEYIFGPYALATFCLMPGGDFPTRKAVMDALLSGCIPVLFHPYTAMKQMKWHWHSLRNAQLCLHHIPYNSMMKEPLKQFEILLQLSKNETFVFQKKRKIAHIGNRMQYNAPRGFMNKLYGYQEDNDTPIDAVEVILRNLLIKQSDWRQELSD